ncbi:PREDICTED: protein STAY-GREEN LIKE, chloroplastic-like [Nicotiana attenuata]|uniref:protein STAY-GREEN LIKE, chloroplastic-like n=1 Tax=Nicotiana attenuata TaxID=49451 RepID=UPI000904E99F|nr:PREDICTED: protein STAY-GREEN LIKE, chloroplastic-like [Nicotiana attenuata]
MQSMASHHYYYSALSSSSPNRDHYSSTCSFIYNCQVKHSTTPAVLQISSFSDRKPPYNTLVFQAVRLLGPPARFEASKLEVLLKGEEVDTYSTIVPRTYTLSHCDFTANLTLTISNNIQYDQLKGWYNKDDVVAEWTEVKGNLFLDVHCYVSGPNPLQELAAEFRYHIFSKELPLVLEAVLYGDSDFFKEHEELMNAIVRVYFHSSSKKYNRVECWGPLKDAAKGRQGDHINSLLSTSKEDFHPPKILSAKSIFQALFTFLL